MTLTNRSAPPLLHPLHPTPKPASSSRSNRRISKTRSPSWVQCLSNGTYLRLKSLMKTGKSRLATLREQQCGMHNGLSLWRLVLDLEQEIPLRHGQHPSWLTGEQLPIGKHLIGLGVHLDGRRGGVQLHGGFADAPTGVAHGHTGCLQTQVVGKISVHSGLGDGNQLLTPSPRSQQPKAHRQQS